MANVKSGVNLIWKGTNASIPSGYSRNTDMDDKFPKGTANATDPNNTGGNTTHTHNGSSHSHSLGAHTHSTTIQRNPANTNNDEDNDGAHAQHTHGSTTSGAMTGSSVGNATGTFDAYSNNPPYYEVIFIESDGSKGVPNNVSVLSEIGAPANYSLDAALNGKYLKGASTGADGGGTGGSTTNQHTITHSHSQSHDQGNATTGNTTNNANSNRRAYAGDRPDDNHTHTVYYDNNTDAISVSSSETQAETVEPAYTKLIGIINNSGSEQNPYEGMVGLWFGTLANIPGGWVLCDGSNNTTDMRGRHLKGTTTVGNLGNTGGSNTHTHANWSHNHGGTFAHDHTGSTSTVGGYARGSTSGSYYTPPANHDHPITVASSSPTVSSANVSADSQNNEPEYRTTAFIKYEGADFVPRVGFYV